MLYTLEAFPAELLYENGRKGSYPITLSSLLLMTAVLTNFPIYLEKRWHLKIPGSTSAYMLPLATLLRQGIH